MFQENNFLAGGRTEKGLEIMLRESEAVVSAWREEELVEFGWATSNGAYRAVLWDVVVTRE